MAPIEIDYRLLTYIIIGLFALLGFNRGWLREALATILLMALVVMLAWPEVAEQIIAILGKMITAVLEAIAKRLPDPTKLEDLIKAIKGLFNVENPYTFMILVTVVLIVLSYVFGKRALTEAKLAPLSRLLGGTLGALNGFIVLSLLREYLLTRLGLTLPGAALSAAPSGKSMEAARQLTVGIKNVPTRSMITETTAIVLLALGLVVFAFFIREIRSRKATKKG